MVGMNIDLLEMDDGGLEDLDVRKSHGKIICKSDPEMAVTLGGFQDFLTRSLGENGLRRVACKECGCSELDGGQPREILGPCRGNLVSHW